MWICEGSKIDWTAIAAILALVIWVVDNIRRYKERAATCRLLSQIMTTPVGIAQLEIAKFRVAVVPPSGDKTNILDLIDKPAARKAFAARALEVKLELPTQFLEKADLFGERTSNRLAFALSQTSRLHSVWKMLGELPSDSDPQEVNDHMQLALEQIKETEKAIGEAFNAVLASGKST